MEILKFILLCNTNCVLAVNNHVTYNGIIPRGECHTWKHSKNWELSNEKGILSAHIEQLKSSCLTDVDFFNLV